MKRLYAIGIMLLSFTAYQCSTVAVTGRKQLNLIPDSQILPLSANQYVEVLQSSQLSSNQEQREMITRVGKRIQKAVETYFANKGSSSELEDYNWEYNLIEDDQVNAWAMPGGKVAFYTGILPICQDDKGVAVVMGHEIAHAIANHGRERMSQGMVAQLGLSSLQAALGQNPTMTKNLLLQASGLATNLGVMAFGRSQESEADYLGLIFMSMAGYDPKEAPQFWQRMAAQTGGSSTPEFLSTHPSNDTRINDLNNWIPEAMKYFNKGR
ncbi:MAG: M48 family metallopeptidase [Bacteroidota bacterium]